MWLIKLWEKPYDTEPGFILIPECSFYNLSGLHYFNFFDSNAVNMRYEIFYNKSLNKALKFWCFSPLDIQIKHLSRIIPFVLHLGNSDEYEIYQIQVGIVTKMYDYLVFSLFAVTRNFALPRVSTVYYGIIGL